ncbi:hypothetical protein QTG54_000497 [Skeletonema marinoi]|uniref:Uncharacterized protein n=1 Tax=Skeletonema marinoi TaxID=267567 RepID=A0AAD9DKC9_9STRA|nr:hypothetical protein QTG54_000497 [Skeletonema marinoi]
MVPVDVIFLDIDGVLLPFGSAKKSSQDEDYKCDDCIFPKSTMNALTKLLQKVGDISLKIKDGNNKQQTIKGNPVLVLSSTWRAQQEFINDILNSFKGYVAFVQQQEVQQIWKPHLDAFFDLVDPCYHATRHDEIFSWIRDNERGKNNHNNNSSNKKRKRRTPQELECSSLVVDFQVRSWIALDDEDLVNVEEDRVEKKAIPHAVKTESSVGLTLQDVQLGVKLLEDQMHAFYQLT